MNIEIKACVLLFFMTSMCLKVHSQEVIASDNMDQYKVVMIFDTTTETESKTNTTFWTTEFVLVIKNGVAEFQTPVVTGIQNGKPISTDDAEQLVSVFGESSFRVVENDSKGEIRAEVEGKNSYLRLVAEALFPPQPPEEISIGDVWEIERGAWYTDKPNVTLMEDSTNIRPSFGVYECNVSSTDIGLKESVLRSSPSTLSKYSYMKSNEADLYGIHAYVDPKTKELIKSKIRSFRDITIYDIRTRFLMTVSVERISAIADESAVIDEPTDADEPLDADEPTDADEPKVLERVILKNLPPPKMRENGKIKYVPKRQEESAGSLIRSWVK